MRASLPPVVFFVLSVPVAFFATWIVIVMWFFSVPTQIVLDRRKPDDFDEYFG